MEDRVLDLMIGEGPSARSVRIDLPRFTLVGATTRQGLLTTPLRDRFGIPIRLQFYSVEELEKVLRQARHCNETRQTPCELCADTLAHALAAAQPPAGELGGKS